MNNLTDQLEATEQRFAERAATRRSTDRQPGTAHLLRVNDSQSVTARLKRLGVDRKQIEKQGKAGLTPGIYESLVTEPSDSGRIATRLGIERILGHNDLIGVSFLEMGTQVARAIGRINVSVPEGGWYGTGFLVSPRLLLTNHHVLANTQQAAAGQIEFNFQDDIHGRPANPMKFRLDPETFFATDAELDYSLVAVADNGSGSSRLADFGHIPLASEEGRILVGELVNIIQHPNGEPKQMALRENQIMDQIQNFLHYVTDTAPGSSGSPVFNDQWELVALHHSGVPRRNADGQILTRTGQLWDSSQGEGAIDWIANEGVRIERICQHLGKLLKKQRLTKPQARLLEEALAGSPSSSVSQDSFPAQRDTPETVDAPADRPAPISVQSDNGDMVVTLPLQIRLDIRRLQQTMDSAYHNGHSG